MLACSLLTPASAQTIDFGPAKQSLNTLTTLTGSINAANATIKNLWMGPGQIAISCGFECNWYTFGICTKTLDFKYSADFSGIRTEMQSMLQNSSAQTDTFTSGFNEQLQQWLTVTVPRISGQFETVANDLQQLQQNLASTPPDQAKQRVKTDLNRISASLNQGRTQLTAIMQQLAKFLQAQSDAITALNKNKDARASTVAAEFTKLQTTIHNQPCGQEQAQAQFILFKTMIGTSITSMGNAFATLQQKAGEANNGGSVLLGTLTNMGTRVAMVSSQIDKAQTSGAINTAIQNLQIKVALQAWNDFAVYAAGQK